MAIGFAGGALTRTTGGSIDAAWVGGLSATVAALELVRPGHYLVTGGAAGVLAALWTSLMQAQGLPGIGAYTVAATVTCLCAYLSGRRPDFAPILVREEALLGLGALALVMAMAPAISRGWQSALALNATDGSAATPLVPVWMTATSAATRPASSTTCSRRAARCALTDGDTGSWLNDLAPGLQRQGAERLGRA